MAGGSQRFAVVAAAGAWFAVAGITVAWPDLGDWGRGYEFALGAAGVAILFALAALMPPRFEHTLQRLYGLAPWGIVSGIFFAVWQALTAKSAILPMPFFPPPQAILEVFTDDWAKLFESVTASFRLLSLGVLIGALVGFITGVSIGWSRAIGYWVHPVMRLIGPLPSIAWLPIAFFAFPSSWSASIFLIALAVGFSMAVLTWSGVANVNPAYYDVARTLGANSRFLILKVAIPPLCLKSSWAPSWDLALPCRAGHSRNDGRESRARLLSAMGAGLGCLCQYVCGAHRHVADVLGSHHGSFHYATIYSPIKRVR